jgi:hypothetical protein
VVKSNPTTPFLFIKDLSVGAPLPLHLTTNVGALYQLRRGK